MKYCMECGTKLELRKCKEEGMVPFCHKCEMFRFPMFNAAIIAIVLSPDKKRVLLIQQYGKKDNILVAGYVNQGESTEHALIREVGEELGRTVVWHKYLRSHYFDKSNSLMFNYVCQIDSDDLSHANYEIDRAAWYSFEDAKIRIKDKSLAEKFLVAAIEELQLV